ncbi:hypothetical protein ACFY20_08980 [Streptomyces sp. NPDC001312]|uniref:hypothetical protein n=1 Tax=Streptomyces sp. NPDC001312 TaxID=3364561 RepID=UPI0036C0D029
MTAREPLYGSAADAVRDQLREQSELSVAVSVARDMLATYADVDHGDIFALNQAHGAIREALRILLRALGADEKGSGLVRVPGGDQRCPAAHPEDPTPCGGPIVVTVLDATNAGARGCEHHGARLLASLDGGRVYPLPDAPEGAAIRVFKAADSIDPFPWLTDAPRTTPSQLSNDENRRRGESQ